MALSQRFGCLLVVIKLSNSPKTDLQPSRSDPVRKIWFASHTRDRGFSPKLFCRHKFFCSISLSWGQTGDALWLMWPLQLLEYYN